MEIYFFILWFVDSVTILPYMLTYMYWDTNIVHVIILLYIFYYCQIDKILTEEWVMTYIPAVSWSVFSAILLYYIELNVQLEDFKTFVTGFGGQ